MRAIIIIISAATFLLMNEVVIAQETTNKPVSFNELVQLPNPVKKDKNEVVVQNKLRRIGEPAVSINPGSTKNNGQGVAKGEVIYNKPRRIGEPANIKSK